MTLHLLPAHALASWDGCLRDVTVQPGTLAPVELAPGDGQRYRVVTGLLGASPATRFFAIARGEAALLGALLPVTASFVDYIEALGEWHDLELLWAGWRLFLFVAGRPDEAPPRYLPRWRDDWYAPLATVPLATYACASDSGPWTVTLHRDGPRAFRVAISDPHGRLAQQIGGYAESVEALAAVAARLGARFTSAAGAH